MKRSRSLCLGGLAAFFLFAWGSFVFSSFIGDIKIFMAAAHQARYLSGSLLVGAFRSWELKSVFSRLLSCLIYRIAVLFAPYGTYAFECVCKGIYSLLLLLCVFLSMRLLFGRDRRKVLWSAVAVSTLFMASAIDCHMQVEMSSALLVLLAFSLYWNAASAEKKHTWKLLASGVLIGSVFWFKSLLILLSVSVVAAVCVFLLETGRKLSVKRMLTVAAGSVLSLAAVSLLVYLINPSEFREIVYAGTYQGSFFYLRIMLRKSVLAFLRNHLEKPAFTPALWIGFACLVLNLVRHIRERKGSLVFFHLVLWGMPALFILVSDYYFPYHFVPYLFPAAVELGDFLLRPTRAREILLGTLSAAAAVWFAVFLSVLSSNNRTCVRLELEARQKTEDFLREIDFDRSETVLYLDDGSGAYMLGNPSRLKYFFPLPLQRLNDESSHPAHVEALDGAMSFEGKYISVDYDFFFCGWRYPQLEEKIRREYTRVGSFAAFNPPHAVLPAEEFPVLSLDLYVRNDP